MPDVLINGYGYGYNKVGMKMYEQRAHDSNLGNVFKYDAVHRLTGVKYNSPEPIDPDTTQFEKTWEAHYDQVDNILSIIKTQNQQTETITPEIPAGTDNSRLNQYAAFGQFSLTYDANGNTKSKGDQHFYYNYRNQLVRISEGGSTTAEYKYDVMGRRIEKNMGSDIFRYFFSGNHVIEERDGADAITRQFFYGDGIDEILRMDRYINGVPSPYYFHTNAIGSVTAINDGNGNLVERMSYDVFGSATVTDYMTDQANPAIVDQSVIGNDILFHARRYDTETGLYYYRARQYDPLMGRFLQTDPMGYFDSMNLYQAFNMNGVNFRDPMGLHYSRMELKFIIAHYEMQEMLSQSEYNYYTTDTEGNRTLDELAVRTDLDFRISNLDLDKKDYQELFDYVESYTGMQLYKDRSIWQEIGAALNFFPDEYKKNVYFILTHGTERHRRRVKFKMDEYGPSVFHPIDEPYLNRSALIQEEFADISAEATKIIIEEAQWAIIAGSLNKVRQSIKMKKAAGGIKGTFTNKKFTYRIDTNKVSPGEGGFHIHVFDDGKEIAKITGRGGFVERHKGQILLKPSQINKQLRREINALVKKIQKSM